MRLRIALSALCVVLSVAATLVVSAPANAEFQEFNYVPPSSCGTVYIRALASANNRPRPPSPPGLRQIPYQDVALAVTFPRGVTLVESKVTGTVRNATNGSVESKRLDLF